MKLKLKKWMAGLLGAVLMLGMTGCLGNFYENVADIDGTEIQAGLYQMAQMSAYIEARNKVEDSEKDVLSQKVDGQSAAPWIRARAEELCRRYVCVLRLTREKKISLDSTSQENVEQMMQYWTYLEETYAENGISEATMRRYMNNEQLGRQLFLAMYGEGGELAVPDADLKEEYSAENAHVRFFTMSLHNTEEDVDKTDEIQVLADAMVERLKAGDTMEDVAREDMEAVYGLLGRDFDPETIVGSITTSYIRYNPDNYDTYSEEFLAQLKTQEIGEFGNYNMGSTILVYEKIPAFEDQDEFESMKTTIIEALKTEEFEEYLRAIYNKYPAKWSFGARWFYSPRKITYF